jgi:hypothetical protein
MPRVTVVIDAELLASLDAEAAMLGTSRSKVLRRRLSETEPRPVAELPAPTRETTLAKLEHAAARGNVAAMTTLARELRLTQAEPPAEPPVQVDELTRWRRRHEATT